MSTLIDRDEHLPATAVCPVGGFLATTLSDFPGEVAAMVFPSGCTMACPYCHNRQLWSIDGAQSCAGALARLAALRPRLGGVVVSGGEPTMHAGLPALVLRLRSLGLRVKLDTNGSRPAMLAELLAAGLLDYVALDLKAPWGAYARVAGVPGMAEAVQASLALLRAHTVDYELRSTLCTPLHDAGALSALASIPQPGERWFLQPYRSPEPPQSDSGALRAIDPDRLYACRAAASRRGIDCRIRGG
ncbi:MAG: anaerobic ribonucleoside-triphosphate reductase activating protein [Planctomycetota bacterium]